MIGAYRYTIPQDVLLQWIVDWRVLRIIRYEIMGAWVIALLKHIMNILIGYYSQWHVVNIDTHSLMKQGICTEARVNNDYPDHNHTKTRYKGYYVRKPIDHPNCPILYIILASVLNRPFLHKWISKSCHCFLLVCDSKSETIWTPQLSTFVQNSDSNFAVFVIHEPVCMFCVIEWFFVEQTLILLQENDDEQLMAFSAIK